MPVSIDCLVIGGGTAGLAAAVEASRRGLEVMVVDERRELRAAPAEGFGPNVTVLRSSIAWGVFPGGVVSVITPGDSLDLAPKATIIAAGAHDRLLPFAGWEHQSVATADEALEAARGFTTRMRWLVAGIGSDGLRLAGELAGAGHDVVYADASPVHVDASAGSSSGPQHGSAGRLEYLPGHLIAAVRGHDRIEAVELSDAGGRTMVRQHIDAVCVAYARAPRVELAWLAGCEMEHQPDLGGAVPRRRAGVRTSVDGVFVAGDAAGLCRPEAAALEGRLAGALAARQVAGDGAGRTDPSVPTLREPMESARSADAAALRGWIRLMWELEDRFVREAMERGDVFLCRCELVPGPAVREAFADLASTPADVKRATRVGMGECQGQHCRALIARAAAARTGQPVVFERPISYRPPVRPILLGQLIGDGAEGSGRAAKR